MMKKLLLFTLLGSLFFAQQKEEAAPAIYDKYPKGQSDYNGGNIQFYKELHQLIVDKKIQPCESKTELYSVRFVVYPDATIKFVKEEYPENVEKNKCAFDLTRKLFKYLDGWKPAEVDGQKVAAITSMIIFPDALFDKYTEGYDAVKYFGPPAEFPGGIEAFRNKFSRNVNANGFKWDQRVQLVMYFKVDENGNAIDFRMDPSSGNVAFDEMLIKSAKWIKGKWKPATLHGVNIKTGFRFPIVLSEN
ncbi:energy transducer TonB [Elizabethkingia miricola]|nr:energy transducer TonB [Elizabethkingia miricola]